MKVCFQGGTKEVGRSSVLIKFYEDCILFDHGIKPLPKKGLHSPLPLKEKLDAAFITHGHLDHLGALPLIHTKIFGMEITSHFLKLLLMDSLKIAKQEGYFIGFDIEDVNRTVKSFEPIEYGEEIVVGNTKIVAYDAGHIPGSCMFLAENKGSVLYTGDFKLSDTRLVKGSDIKVEADVLIIESTYSDREHPERVKEEKKFIEFINETLNNDGIVLLPSFAVARSQEIILILAEYGVNATVFVDGMATISTEIINAYPELQRKYNSLKKALQRLDVSYVEPHQRKKILKRPCIIIAGSGMLEGGVILEYLKRVHDKENCSIAFTGFQVPGTAGYELLKTSRININGKDLLVKANIKKFDFSSHASRSELFELIDRVNPQKIFCIHGDKTEEFASELREKGFDAISPDATCYDINL
ncbi:MAG: MBL fold metallo-hydrolase [Candidatus Aenigmatarchaeota archaeon]